MFGSWDLNEIWIVDLSLALVGMLLSSPELFLFSNEGHSFLGIRLLLDFYCVKVVKHVALFTVCAN